jgi:hypothetical protein
MKRVIYPLVIIFILTLAAAVFLKSLIIFFAKRQLSNIFVGSTVDIGACDLQPLRKVSLKDIHISRQETYDFKVKETAAEYSLFSLLRGNIRNVSLSDAAIEINLAQNSLWEFGKLLNLKNQKSALRVNSLQLSNLGLDIESPELMLKAQVSAGIDLINQSADYFALRVVFLEGSGLQLKDAFVEAKRKSYPGLLRIAEIKYDKLAIKKIEGKARLEDKSLFLDSLSAEVLGGAIRGSAHLELRPAGEYLVELQAKDVDLAAFINDFNLGEKVSLSGSLSGSVTLQTKGYDISLLSGDFSAEAPGGMLTIKDTAYLEGIARSSSQPMDLLVESFKNYRYNTGMMKLSFEKDNLILDIVLEGEAGRRNLSVTLHDFKLRR